MYIEGGKACWLNHIINALDRYNNRVQRTTRITPFEKSFLASTNINTAKLAATPTSHKPIPNLIPTTPKYPEFPKFQVGDFVRVPDKQNLNSKGYTTNWKREFFKIHRINSTNPVTYTLEDENREIIQGKYNEQELLNSALNFKSNNKTLESMNIFHQYQ